MIRRDDDVVIAGSDVNPVKLTLRAKGRQIFFDRIYRIFRMYRIGPALLRAQCRNWIH